MNLWFFQYNLFVCLSFCLPRHFLFSHVLFICLTPDMSIFYILFYFDSSLSCACSVQFCVPWLFSLISFTCCLFSRQPVCIYRLSLSLSFVMFLIKLCLSCLFHGLLLEPRCKFLVSTWPELFCIMYFLWLSSAIKPLLSFILWVWVLYLGPIFLPQSAHRFRSKSG